MANFLNIELESSLRQFLYLIAIGSAIQESTNIGEVSQGPFKEETVEAFKADDWVRKL